MISIEQAFELIDETVSSLPKQDHSLLDSVGCILADNICADVASPPHDKSVMDGFAVRSTDVAAGHKRLKVVETIIAGGWPEKTLGECEAARIMTGAPIPSGCDAVVMVELCETESEGADEFVVLNVDGLEPEKHVLRAGANFQTGQIIFKAGHKIRPTDVGLLAEVGAASIQATQTPTVSVIATGNELVDCSNVPGRGEIRNSNGPMLVAMARDLGLQVDGLGLGKDDPGQLRDLITKGLESNLLLLTGGVSAGTMDLVPGILQELGVEQVFHKVKVKPGKPIWFGVLNRSSNPSYVFGLPGNPVSSLVGFRLFVRAAIGKLVGGSVSAHDSVLTKLTKSHECRGDRPTYWPAKWVVSDTVERRIEPLGWSGSSDLLALGEAQGLAFFPAGAGVCPAETEVQFYPFDS